MKPWILIALALIVALLIESSVAVFDYIGVNQQYGGPLETDFETAISSMAPDAGVLEISCYFWEDYVSMSATIDNSTTENVGNTLIAGLRAYMRHYNDRASWPNKAEIIVKKPGGPYGELVGSGVVYSKWIDDYNLNAINNETNAQQILVSKLADTVR